MLERDFSEKSRDHSTLTRILFSKFDEHGAPIGKEKTVF